jgi:hypothetical protein
MAIKIPIITVFDNKGLRAAQYQLNKVSGSFSALGRNFAIAGTAIGVFTTGLGVAVKAASNFEAEYEGVNQVFGSAAKSVQAFAVAASKTAGLSETAALQGAKTFGLFAKSAKLGEEEAAKFATSLVQLAGDLGSFNDVPTEEALAALQSGLMGQSEPLRKFGVFLTDTKLRAEAQAMAIYDGTGALTDQQKMLASYSLIMKDTQIQQGDFVKYQNTFGNAFKTVQTDIQNITKDIGMELLPIIAEVTPIIGQLAREFGWKLANAVKSVDWESVIGSLVQFFTFVVSNIETITRLATSLFLLNTAFNAVRAATGLYNAAATILNATFTITAGKIALTTGALKLFRTALVTTGIGALVVGLGFIIEAIINTNDAAKDGQPIVTNYGGALQKSGADAEWAAGKYGIAKGAIDDLNRASANYKSPSIVGPDAFERRMNLERSFAQGGMTNYMASLLGVDGKGSSSGSGSSTTKAVTSALAPVNKALELGRKQAEQAAALKGKGFSETYIENLFTSATKPVAAAKLAVQKATKNANYVVNQNKKAASTLEAITKQNEANAQAQAAIDAAAEQARQEGIRREAEALAERQRIIASFGNSVISTFAAIREGIINSFNLPQLGSSTDAIIRNMGKLLTKTREFSANITKLSSMGLDPQLLQQIISQGPIAGARLAAGLVSGGVSGLTAINTGYAELSGLGTAIGTTGTNALFGTERQQNIYNIEVNGGVGSGATIGQAIVDAIKAYERTSGAVWQGA